MYCELGGLNMPLITISSPFGSGGKEIAQFVAKGLKLEIYDDRKLLELSPQAGIRSQDLKDLRQLGFLDRIFSNKPKATASIFSWIL